MYRNSVVNDTTSYSNVGLLLYTHIHRYTEEEEE